MRISFIASGTRKALLAGGLIATAVFGLASPAYADPHAVFYTVSGQQQLFFNILAALDQADYVELAKKSEGTPPTSSRQGLLENRAKAGFGKTSNAILNATETSLNNILTRNVTLEGQDLWTTYVNFQVALEAQRRKDTAALLEFYCQRVLGIKNCRQNAEGPRQSEARKSAATEVRPLDPWVRAVADGIGVLFSGTASDQQDRRRRINPNNPDPDKGKAFNPYIAQINKNVAGDANKQSLWASMVATVSSIGYAQPNPQAFDDLVFDGDTVRIADDATIDDFTRTLASISSLNTSLLEARIAAEEQRLKETEQTTVNGVKADTYAIPHTLDGQLAEIGTGVKVGAAVKAAQAQGLSNGLTDLVGNPYYVGTRQSPGQQKLIPGGQQHVAGIASDSGSVLGATTDSQTGKVAASVDDANQEDGEIKDEIPEPIVGPDEDPSLDPARSVDEKSIVKILKEVAGVNQPGVGVTVDDVADNYGQDIINGLTP